MVGECNNYILFFYLKRNISPRKIRNHNKIFNFLRAAKLSRRICRLFHLVEIGLYTPITLVCVIFTVYLYRVFGITFFLISKILHHKKTVQKSNFAAKFLILYKKKKKRKKGSIAINNRHSP